MPLRTILLQKQIKTKKWVVDPIFYALITFSFGTTAYYATVGVNLDQTLFNRAIFMSILGLVGLVLFRAVVGHPFRDKFISRSEMDLIAVSIFVGIVVIKILMISVIATYETYRTTIFLSSATDMPSLFLLFNIGIQEELFFRYYLQSAITKHTKEPITPIILTSVIFTGFHVPYSGNIAYFLAVFSASLTLGVIYYITRRPSVVMLCHGLGNVL